MTHLFLTLLFSLRVEAAEHKIHINFATQFKGNDWVGAWEEKPGYPKVPVYTYRWLIPNNEKVVSVWELNTKLERKSYDTKVSYVPVPKPMCDVKVPSVEKQSYRLGEIYPESILGETSEIIKHGYHLLEITLYPVQTMISESLAVKTLETEFIIETEKNSREGAMLNPLPSDLEDLKKLEGNLSSLSTYPTPQGKRSSKTYLVVGPEAYLNDLSTWQLLEEKAGRGVTTGVHSLESIAAGAGQNIQEKVRLAIKKHYQEDGTRYVLLVGNGYNLLPTKYFKVDNENIGSDLYFGCFDGELDLACEVAVGRAPVSNISEYKTFVQKTLDARAALGKRNKLSTLLFGEKMDKYTLAGKALEQLAKGGKAGSIVTKGFPSHVTVTRFNETSTKTFTASEVINKINQGDYFTVNHMGHASQTYCMRYKSPNIPTLTNKTTFFGITQGCHPGQLTGPNWASSMVLAPNGGAFAQIANESFGWYNPGSSDGPSNRHHLVFYDAVFSEGIKEIGRANIRAKERLSSQANSSIYMKKVLVETNLFGDPEIQLPF